MISRYCRISGVESVSFVRSLPLGGLRNSSTITIDGAEPGPGGEVPAVEYNLASANYFSTMGIPLRRGRTFAASDDARGAPVLLVNDAFVRRYFGGSDPIGHRLHFGGPAAPNPWMTIVGVVGDVLNERLELQPRPMLYRPMTQATNLSLALIVRTASDPARLAGPGMTRPLAPRAALPWSIIARPIPGTRDACRARPGEDRPATSRWRRAPGSPHGPPRRGQRRDRGRPHRSVTDSSSSTPTISVRAVVSTPGSSRPTNGGS